MIERRIFIGLLAVFITMATLAYIGINERDRMAKFAEAQKARSIQNGAAIFETHCAPCHGNEGQGIPGRAPTLNSKHFFTERLKELNYQGTLESYVALTVAGGRPVKTTNQYSEIMPTWGDQFGGPLRQDEVNDVVAFVMNWEATAVGGEAIATPPPADDPAARGEALFNREGCSACHTVTGVSTGEVGPNLTNVYEKGEDYIRQSILDPNAVIAEGFSENVMPQTFGDVLSEQDLNDLIAFFKKAAGQ
ncbi:MAG: hypothetical protein D6796_08350 [Caldilineae bacterium]|nr:MAG: hypothetical protein D6796_08350 [Caldilineae bacterium]